MLGRTIFIAAVALSLTMSLWPVQATHTHSINANYTSGGSVRVYHGVPDVPTGGGATVCAIPGNFPASGGPWMVCIGGRIQASEHAASLSSDGQNHWELGYTLGSGVPVDQATGSNIGYVFCMKDQTDDSTCNNLRDVSKSGCGVTLAINTATDYLGTDGLDGFKAIGAVIFTNIVFVDPATSTVCLATTGDVAITFSA